MRHGQPRIDQCPAAIVVFETPKGLEDRRQLGSDPIRLLGEVSGERTAGATQTAVDHLGQAAVGAPRATGERPGPA